MNQKLKTAIESAIRLSAGLRMKDESISSVAVSINVDAFITALREQGVVVTWAEPANQMLIDGLQAGLDYMREKGVDGLSPWKDYPPPNESITVVYKAMIQASQQE